MTMQIPQRIVYILEFCPLGFNCLPGIAFSTTEFLSSNYTKKSEKKRSLCGTIMVGWLDFMAYQLF